MPRHALAPFEIERITTQPHPDQPGLVRARARYRREQGGPLLDVYGRGKTKGAAERDLRTNLEGKRTQHHGGSQQITPKTTAEQAAKVWLLEKQVQRPALARRTLGEYEKWVAFYVGGTAWGRLTVTAASNVIRGEQHLRDIANGSHKKGARGGEGAMKSARKVMHGIVDTAYRHGALQSPTRFRLQGRTVAGAGRSIDTGRAFTREELRSIQAEADSPARASADVGDLVAFLSALGPRISEALHGVSWTNVDLDGGTVKIQGTKSKNAVRTVTMPKWLVGRLRLRGELHGRKGLVFGVTRYSGKAGQPRDLSNVLDSLRSVLDAADCEWAGSHTFRRTVATLLDEAGVGTGAIATVLGQDPVTTSTYIKTRPIGNAAADVLDTAF